MPEVPCPRCDQPQPLLGWREYGAWGVQRPGFGCLGRFDPSATRLLPDSRTFALDLRLDRAAYDLYRQAGVPHDQALDDALICGAWAGTLDVTGEGLWEAELRLPASPHVEYVAMLWPHDDALWPHGEINLAEGRVGTGTTMLNLHWAGPDGQAEHDPAHISLDVTQWHRYGVELRGDLLRWLVDGRVVRELVSEHVPSSTRLHLVLQCGVNPSVRDAYHDDFSFSESILWRPIKVPDRP